MKAILFCILLPALSFAQPFKFNLYGGWFNQNLPASLTLEQRLEVQSILLEQAPTALNILKKMLDNRRQLLSLTQGQVQLDMEAVQSIATEQAQLLTQLIVWKEQLKAEIRGVLDTEQMQSFDQSLPF